jgi:hypothetical protein
MNAARACEFLTIRRTVLRYQRQIVRLVGTESTLVPLAKMERFFRLVPRPFAAGGVN